jgi:chemotaxis-related protein WspD
MEREIEATQTPGREAPHGWQAEPVYECWNTIGVSGNGSCRELSRYTHCRNCPVFSAAATQFLDRPITPELRREWTEHFTKEKKLTTPARTSVVLFRIGPEWLALPTPAFQEVAERRVIHTLPHRRHGVVLGLVNIRGELLICASLGRLLGLRSETPASRSRTVYERLLVTNWDAGSPQAAESRAARTRLVFPVDEVHGIRRVHHDELRDPPATLARSSLYCTRTVFPWRDHTVGLLDPDVLFTTFNRKLT